MRKTDKSINGQYIYFAFIAYTHDDYAEAEDLYKRLQRFAMPTKIRKEKSIAKRLVPMFLDHHYMNPGTYEKRDNEALKKSKYLIVVCSRKLHEHDENVNKEISDFLSYGNTYEQIIPYIIDKDSEPEKNCFPSELIRIREEENHNLIGANIYTPLGKKDKRQAQIKTIATIHGIGTEKLENEDRKRRRRNIIRSFVLACLCALLALGFYAYISFTQFPCKLDIQGRYDGIKTWHQEMDADVGDVVQFQIEFYNNRGFLTGFMQEFAENNNISIISDNVMIRAILPDNMEYIEDSTMVYNSNHQDGITVGNDLTTSGINIGGYNIGANSYVRFKCKITDVNLAPGTNELQTCVAATIWPPSSCDSEKEAIHVKDSISVNVEK